MSQHFQTKSNRKFVERDKVNTSNSHIHDRSRDTSNSHIHDRSRDTSISHLHDSSLIHLTLILYMTGHMIHLTLIYMTAD